jgi:dienelactone hydrolase
MNHFFRSAFGFRQAARMAAGGSCGRPPEETADRKAERNPPTDTYAEYGELIAAGDHEIPAILCLPTDRIRGAVVMLHGTGSDKNEAGGGYKTAAPILAEKYGLASIRIDFMGSGDSRADYSQYNFSTAVFDAMTARAYLAEGVPSGTNFGIMGWSQGGTDALLAAGENPDVFKSVVTWAGAPDLRSLCSKEEYAEAEKNGWFLRRFDWRDPLKVGRQWCHDVQHTDVLKVFSAYHGPILAIAGTKDDIVDPSWAQKIVAVSTNPLSRAEYIEGADHTFLVLTEKDSATIKRVSEDTGAFFQKTLTTV